MAILVKGDYKRAAWTDLPTHLANQEIWCRVRDLQRSRKGDRAKRAVRRHTDVVCLGHVGDPSSFRYATGMRDVRLDDVDATGLKVRSNVLPREQSFPKLAELQSVFCRYRMEGSAHSDRNVRFSVEFFHFGYLAG